MLGPAAKVTFWQNTPTTWGRIKVIHKFTISCAQLSAPANGRRDKTSSNTHSSDWENLWRQDRREAFELEGGVSGTGVRDWTTWSRPQAHWWLCCTKTCNSWVLRSCKVSNKTDCFRTRAGRIFGELLTPSFLVGLCVNLKRMSKLSWVNANFYF